MKHGGQPGSCIECVGLGEGPPWRLVCLTCCYRPHKPDCAGAGKDGIRMGLTVIRRAAESRLGSIAMSSLKRDLRLRLEHCAC